MGAAVGVSWEQGNGRGGGCDGRAGAVRQKGRCVRVAQMIRAARAVVGIEVGHTGPCTRSEPIRRALVRVCAAATDERDPWTAAIAAEGERRRARCWGRGAREGVAVSHGTHEIVAVLVSIECRLLLFDSTCG